MTDRSPLGEDDLQALIDDRLAGDRRTMVEAYISGRPDIEARIAVERGQRDLLRKALSVKFVEPVPARLRIAHIRAARRAAWRGRLSRAAAALLLLAAGAGGGWLAHDRLPRDAAPAMVTRDAVAAYRTFAVEVAHPVEVDASNEAHLVRWLSKRLGRTLTAPDLGRFGFRLMGGRLLSARDGAAAQLMYQADDGRRLTVYVQASDGAETAFRFRQEGETATFAWLDQGFGFAVTAQSDRRELLPIAEAVYHSLDERDSR
jgi:anti-sigma factor RsiW